MYILQLHNLTRVIVFSSVTFKPVNQFLWIVLLTYYCRPPSVYHFDDYTKILQMCLHMTAVYSEKYRVAVKTKLPTEPCALGSTQALKLSTRKLLGLKTAGA